VVGRGFESHLRLDRDAFPKGLPQLLESAAMKRLNRSLAVLLGSGSIVVLTSPGAWAQTAIDPSVTPVENPAGSGPITPFGIHTSFAVLLGIFGLLVALVIVILYLRYAPRFAKDEESLKVVRADRVRIGEELPRRNVDLSQANPVLVAPPAIPSTVGAPSLPPAAAAPAAAAPAATAAPAAVPPAAQAGPAPVAAAPAPAPAPPAPAERVEVSLDQEVFDSTLAELLAAGTDRRIAEGKARRAGMIAAKKKAAGEG
jgi:hypothetical protein